MMSMTIFHQTGYNAGLFQQKWNSYESYYFILLYKIYCFIGILPFWTPIKLIILHARLFINMIIPHVKIIAFQTIIIIIIIIIIESLIIEAQQTCAFTFQ